MHQQRCSEKENVHHINGCHFKTYPLKHFMRLDLGLIIFRRIKKKKNEKSSEIAPWTLYWNWKINSLNGYFLKLDSKEDRMESTLPNCWKQLKLPFISPQFQVTRNKGFLTKKNSLASYYCIVFHQEGKSVSGYIHQHKHHHLIIVSFYS